MTAFMECKHLLTIHWKNSAQKKFFLLPPRERIPETFRHGLNDGSAITHWLGGSVWAR